MGDSDWMTFGCRIGNKEVVELGQVKTVLASMPLAFPTCVLQRGAT